MLPIPGTRWHVLNRILVGGLLLASVLAIAILHHFLGAPAGMLVILPAMAGAWYFGLPGGLAILLFDFLLGALIAGPLAAIGLDRVVILFAGTLAAIFIGRVRRALQRHEETIRERTRLSLEQRTYLDFMALLNEIVRASLEAEDMPSMLQMLARRVSELFAVDDCMITRWDEAAQAPIPTVAHGSLNARYSSLPQYRNEPNLTRSVLEARRPLAIENVHQTPYIGTNVARLFPSPSVLGLPLIAGERRLGAVLLGFEEGHRFSQDEIARGELAARQISLAIMKVLLLEEARQRVRELAGLHMISQAFTLSGDNRQLFGTLTGSLAGLIQARMCLIGLCDEARGIMRACSPGFGIGDEILQTLQYPLTMGDRAWDFSKGLLTTNAQEEIPVDFIGLARSLGIESVLVAPLVDVERRLLGAIYAANKEGGFTADDARLMEIFAGQVAVVVQNSALLASERRRAHELAVLHAVAAAAAEASDEDELLERASELVGEGLNMDHFAVFLLDGEKQELYLHSSCRIGTRETLVRIPLGVGAIGSTARSGLLRYLPDVSLAPDYIALDPLVQSELCVPLKVEDETIGVLNAERRSLNGFSREDQELLGILAAQISTAIQRLRTARAERNQAIQMERSNAMIKALVQVGARATARAGIDGIFQILGGELSRLGLACVLALSEKDGGHIAVRYTSLTGRALQAVEKVAGKALIGQAVPEELLAPLTGHGQYSALVDDPAAMTSRILPFFSRRTVVRLLQALGIVSGVIVCHLPLVSEDETIGVLWLWGEGLREGDLPALSIFARQVAAAIQNASLLAEVSRLAITDELTGIFNRRHFFDLAAREFGHSQRKRQPLAALILDVDFFKKYNDQYGHQVGDEVLRSVAQRLQTALRANDILGRYGGEEFAVLLPQTDVEAAMDIAGRLHASVADEPIQTQAGPLYVQISIGVASRQPDTISLHALINRADQAMYMAKGSRRGRVMKK